MKQLKQGSSFEVGKTYYCIWNNEKTSTFINFIKDKTDIEFTIEYSGPNCKETYSSTWSTDVTVRKDDIVIELDKPFTEENYPELLI